MRELRHDHGVSGEALEPEPPVRGRRCIRSSGGAVIMLLGVATASTVALAMWALPARAADESPPPLPVVERPLPEQPAVGIPSDTHLDKTPPRATKGLDLVKVGWTYNCVECHKLIKAKWHYDRPMAEHRDIHLDHGSNRFCLNCHHPTDRNAFVDYDGAKIAQGDVVLLCAKCHGPTYRDWKAGVHGRQNGYWLATAGEKTKLRCIQCHDPHSPAFKAMAPLPPLRYPPRAANPPVEPAGQALGETTH